MIHPAVDPLLEKLLHAAQAALGGQFLGLYLHGSLAVGDFNPATSDIDFVGVTSGPLAEPEIKSLEALHTRLLAADPKWAYQLEGSYIPAADLRRYDPLNGPYPSVHEGRFYLARHESHWILQRHILRKQGVILAGPGLRDLIDPVSAEDLRGALGQFLREWWLPLLDHPARLAGDDYQAYAVLTMCRMLYTFENGVIASKPVSARWAQAAFPAQAELIQRALDWPEKPLERVAEIRALIRFTARKILE